MRGMVWFSQEGLPSRMQTHKNWVDGWGGAEKGETGHDQHLEDDGFRVDCEI